MNLLKRLTKCAIKLIFLALMFAIWVEVIEFALLIKGQIDFNNGRIYERSLSMKTGGIFESSDVTGTDLEALVDP